jgi:hypothetical protein
VSCTITLANKGNGSAKDVYLKVQGNHEVALADLHNNFQRMVEDPFESTVCCRRPFHPGENLHVVTAMCHLPQHPAQRLTIHLSLYAQDNEPIGREFETTT